jgi:prepilin signal peptidase PulO-like enzyme (type II secretory pathway)
MTRKDAIPFGPFMVAGGLIATIWGVGITDWYLN